MTAPAPAPARADGDLVVAVDAESLRATVRFDVEARSAEVTAVLDFRIDGPDGLPAFDLRQDIDEAVLDGQRLSLDALAHRDLGAGDGARMRVLDLPCASGSRHRLELRYRLATPDAAGSQPVGWADDDDGVRFDLWMSDLDPGRYLEMWFPAGLCHDRLSVALDIEVAAPGRPHAVLANGEVHALAPGSRWRVTYPSDFTSLSPMLVLGPRDELSVHHRVAPVSGRPLDVTVAAWAGTGPGPESAAADVASWLAQFAARYGAWCHGGRFVALLWDAPRGMEYDGATTACEPALEHEVFHSWFGRGVKPASANDGWIDEAMATWATGSGRLPGSRFAAEPLGLDEEPVLLCPSHAWARSTPREAYPAGGRLLAGLAAMAGGAGAMRSALADWHAHYGGGQASTADLARHMSRWCGRDVTPWWDRYVYGGERPA
jgi:hypothetical protein